MKILLDRFPCHLAAIGPNKVEDVTTMRSYQPTEGSRYLGTTRVIVTDTQIIVAKDSNTGPEIVFQEDYQVFVPSETPAQDSFIVTLSGKMLAFKKDTGCGCGSRLRGWNPYKTLTSNKD